MPRKGYKIPLETRVKMAAAKLGKLRDEQTKIKISSALKGRLKGKETKKKMSIAKSGPNNPRWGKPCTPEHRLKISIAQRGAKSHRWLGGIGREPYAWEFNEELRGAIRERDSYQCKICGAPQDGCNRALDVHHIDYNKKNSDPVNLVALCGRCHSRTNKNRRHWTAFFQELAIRRDLDTAAQFQQPNRRGVFF